MDLKEYIIDLPRLPPWERRSCLLSLGFFGIGVTASTFNSWVQLSESCLCTAEGENRVYRREQVPLATIRDRLSKSHSSWLIQRCHSGSSHIRQHTKAYTWRGPRSPWISSWQVTCSVPRASLNGMGRQKQGDTNGTCFWRHNTSFNMCFISCYKNLKFQVLNWC